MTGVMKAVAFCVCAAVLAAGFVAGRMTASPDSTAAPTDFTAAIRAALGERDAVDRAERTASVLQHLDPDNVLEVVAVYDKMINILDELDIRPFAVAWARFDPAAALEHTLGWPFIDKQKMGASAVIESWAMHDPSAARQAYEETTARLPSLSDDLFLGLVTGWLYSGEGGLNEFIAGLSIVRMEMATTRVAGRLMRSGGPDAVIDWVNSIIEDDAFENKFKKRTFRRGMRIVGRWDPERTAAWALEHEGQPYAVDAPRIVAGRLGAYDGRAAMEWVRDHPDEEQRELATREAFRTWLLTDREGAVAWLESEELTPFHQPAVNFYAKDRIDREPEEAIPWCERILDSDRRKNCLVDAAARWYQRDALAAEAWIQQSELDEDARRIARTPPNKRRRQPRNPQQEQTRD